MLEYHDLSRFGLVEGETATFCAAFANGMEGLFTSERFIYRDVVDGTSWSLSFSAMRQVKARCSVYAVGEIGWEWLINIWLDEPLGDTEERDRDGDLVIVPTDARQLFEVAVRLSEAMLAARQNHVPTRAD